MRRHLTYANVVSTLCLFIVLGGGAYAATRINGKNIKSRSISGKKLKKNSVGGTEVKESKLGQVGRARFSTSSGHASTADTIGGTSRGQLEGAKRWALVDPTGSGPTGSIVRQSGGISVGTSGSDTILNFGSSQRGKPIQVSLASGFVGGEISVAHCDTPAAANPPETISCPGFDSPNFIRVHTSDSGGGNLAKPFYIEVKSP